MPPAGTAVQPSPPPLRAPAPAPSGPPNDAPFPTLPSCQSVLEEAPEETAPETPAPISTRAPGLRRNRPVSVVILTLTQGQARPSPPSISATLKPSPEHRRQTTHVAPPPVPAPAAGSPYCFRPLNSSQRARAALLARPRGRANVARPLAGGGIKLCFRCGSVRRTSAHGLILPAAHATLR